MSEDQMSHVPAPESPVAASQPESGPVSDRDAQDAREARYAKALDLHSFKTAATFWQRFVLRVMAVADAGLAPLVARVAELEAEVAARVPKAAHVQMCEEADREMVRAERAEAALARVTALADDLTAEADGAFGMPELFQTRATLIDAADRLRAALAAAGPAVSDGSVPTDDERWGPIVGWCPHYAPDGECEVEGCPAVSDGEGATSEALGVCLPTTGYSCGHCHRCRPASPVVAPSATCSCGGVGSGCQCDEPIHWVGDAPTSLHGNGAGSFTSTTRHRQSVTCRLCLTLLAREDALGGGES